MVRNLSPMLQKEFSQRAQDHNQPRIDRFAPEEPGGATRPHEGGVVLCPLFRWSRAKRSEWVSDGVCAKPGCLGGRAPQNLGEVRLARLARPKVVPAKVLARSSSFYCYFSFVPFSGRAAQFHGTEAGRRNRSRDTSSPPKRRHEWATTHSTRAPAALTTNAR